MIFQVNFKWGRFQFKDNLGFKYYLRPEDIRKFDFNYRSLFTLSKYSIDLSCQKKHQALCIFKETLYYGDFAEFSVKTVLKS